MRKKRERVDKVDMVDGVDRTREPRTGGLGGRSGRAEGKVMADCPEEGTGKRKYVAERKRLHVELKMMKGNK